MPRYLLIACAVVCLALFASAGTLFFVARIPLPAFEASKETLLLDSAGQVLAPLTGTLRSQPLQLKELPQSLINATLAIEDRRFYEHTGFDWRGIARAATVNLREQKKSQGASTVTQQLARNLFLSHEKTWLRKGKEAIFTLQLEQQWNKQQILTNYLNRIYYGHGAYGARAAARIFFDKEVTQLTLAESSLIAGIPKGPKYYSPLIDFAQSKKRQKQVLQAMVDTGTISSNEAESARAEPLTLRRGTFELASTAPYFTDFVRLYKMEQAESGPLLKSGSGLRIQTTIDIDMQRQAEQTIAKVLADRDGLQVALVALDPRNGHIKAMIGGRDYQKSQFNRVLSAKRQPGSTFKPIVYLSALLNGATAVTKHRSEPAVFYFDKGKKSYEPKNFAGHYAYDWIDMRRAIAQSDNIYAVKTLLDTGPERTVELARKLGINSALQPLPSLALGAFPVSPLELATSYAVLANGGIYTGISAITRITSADGHILFEHKPEKKRIVPAEYAGVLTKLLEGVFVDGGTAHRVAHLLKRPTAGKTGTTNTDAWMVGYTPELLTVVWLGHDQGRQISTAEAYLAAPIFAEFTERALSHVPPKMFNLPDSVVSVYVEEQSGKLGGEGCGRQRLEHFVRGSEPDQFCETIENQENQFESLKPSELTMPDEQNIDRTWVEKLRDWWDSE